MPDFLCIGAQRSGTSWLNANLRAAPDIWLPPCKEVHYFTRSPIYLSPSHLSCEGIAHKFLGRSQEARTWRWLFFGYAHKWIASVSPQERPKQLLWVTRYFFGRPSDEWYLDLFRDGAGRICGEITPDYSLLNEEGVQKVVRLLPRVKVLFLMRDPLDRVLSQLRYHMDGKAHPILRDAGEDQMVEFAKGLGQVLRGDYGRTLAIWRKFVPPENLYLGFYEDIQHKPAEMLDDIQEFLGVGTKISPSSELLTERRNAATPQKFSEKFLRRIAPAHAEAIRGSAEVLGQPASKWLERFEKLGAL
jgi:hypothetical protein